VEIRAAVKISQIAPLSETVPPQLYGGTERVVAYLTDALTELGCEVTLFASAGSSTDAELVAVRDQAVRLDSAARCSALAAELAMLKRVRQCADQFDLLHFHVELLHFPMFEGLEHRTITTLHSRMDYKDYQVAYRAWPKYPLVSISHQQRASLDFANWIGTVDHGIPSPPADFTPQNKGEYLAFVGRFSPEKRAEVAIEIARRSNTPLKLAAKVDRADEQYFRESIEPLLSDPNTDFVGEISERQKPEFLGQALALLFPINWPEPFGLVIIEAMACGTPVIAWDRGSVPEIIEPGVTGVIVDSVDQAVRAIEWARQADRSRIRERFERRFSAKVMAENYLQLYRRQLGMPEQASQPEQASPRDTTPLRA